MIRQLPHAQRTMCSFGRHNILHHWPQSQGYHRARSLDQCSSWFLLTIFPSPPRANVRSLLMIQHCTLPISPTYQAVHVLVLISTQQPHGLERWGMLFSAPKSKHLAIGRTAKQSPLVRMNGIPIPQVRTHKHLGLIFNNTLTWEWPRFQCIQHVRGGCWESCGVLMVTFPRRAWKESTKLQFDPVWNTHALCRVEDPQGPFNACKILSPNDSDWRSLHWRIDLTITPSSCFTKYVKT